MGGLLSRRLGHRGPTADTYRNPNANQNTYWPYTDEDANQNPYAHSYGRGANGDPDANVVCPNSNEDAYIAWANGHQDANYATSATSNGNRNDGLWRRVRLVAYPGPMNWA